jgi:hypothetical protein
MVKKQFLKYNFGVHQPKQIRNGKVSNLELGRRS